jgi:hypothetical protein
MAFRDVIRKQRQSGSGLLSSVGSAAGASMRESIDIRNYLFTKDSLLGALFPNVKGFKADGKTTRTRTSPTSLGDASASAELSDAKLDIISQNTKVAAKNSMVLPSMARDMNVMRQNIVKMVKLSGGKPSTKADMFFMKAAEREKAYESQIQGSKSPTSVSTDTDSSTSASGGGFKGLMMTVVGGLLAALGVAAFKYFTDPEFKNTVDEKIITPLKENFVDPLVNMFKELAGEFLLVAGAVAALKLAFSGITASTIIGAIGRLALNPYVIAAAVAAYMIHKGRSEAEERVDLQQRYNKSLSDPNAPKLTPEEEKKRQELNAKADFGTTEGLADLEYLTETGAGLAAPADLKAIPKNPGLLRQIEEDERRRAARRAGGAAPEPMPPPVGIEAGRGTDRAPAPTPAPTPSTSTGGLNIESIMEQVRRAEGGSMGYDAANRGRAGDTPGGMPGLSRMTVGEVKRLQRERQLFAAGAYQIIPNTMDMILQNGVVKESDVFDKKTQDKMGRWLIERRIKIANRLGEDPQLHLAQEFASIADPSTGKSYYAGRGNNKASIASLDGQSVARASGSQIASASTAVDSARLDASNPMSLIPALMSMATPKTPSIPAQQIIIPSTMDSDLFDALVARATEFA